MPRQRRPRAPTAHLGANVRHLREDAGMSQEELAKKVGNSMHATTVSRIENGASIPSLDVVVSLAAVFEVSMDSLVRSTPPEKKTDDELEIEAMFKAIRGLSPPIRKNLKWLLSNLSQGLKATRVEFSEPSPHDPIVDGPHVLPENTPHAQKW